MVNPVDESDNEEMEVEVEETTPRKRKKRSSASTTAKDAEMKTGRRKHLVWEHVAKKDNGKFECNYCKEVFSGGATRIKAHLGLDGKEGGISRCKQYAPSSTHQQEPPNYVNNIDSNVPPSNSLHQFNIDSDVPPPNSLHQFDPPSPEAATDRNESLDARQAEVDQYIELVKKSWGYTGLTLKIHLKEKTYNECPKKCDVVGYTIYCPKGVMFLDSEKLCDEAENAMRNEIVQILCELCDKDNQQHVLASCCVLPFCDSYSQSLCVQNVILQFLHKAAKECSWLHDLFEKAKRVYLRPSTGEQMISPIELLENIQDMESGKGFWKDEEDALNVVIPLFRILKLFDSFVPNVGYFYEAMKKAKKRIEHLSRTNPEKFGEFLEMFSTLNCHASMQIHAVAAYLNPCYMHNELSIEDEIINKEDVREYLKEYFQFRLEEQESIMGELEKYSSKDGSLFTEDVKSKLKEYHPVTWWEQYGEPIPILKRCAIRLLSQPSSCLSHLGHKPLFEASSFEHLDVLKLNIQMMEEFKKLENDNSIFRPVNLDEIDAPLNYVEPMC